MRALTLRSPTDPEWIPAGDVHVVVDNLSTHSSVETLLWNLGHSRFYFHFLPTGAAWLNLIEGWWNILGHWALDGRNFRDTQELGAAFGSALEGRNAEPIPFAGTRKSGNAAAGGSVCAVLVCIVIIATACIPRYLMNNALRYLFYPCGE